MGAEILEFPFTDSRKGKSFRDHHISLTKKEVLDLIKSINNITILQGDPQKILLDEPRDIILVQVGERPRCVCPRGESPPLFVADAADLTC